MKPEQTINVLPPEAPPTPSRQLGSRLTKFSGVYSDGLPVYIDLRSVIAVEADVQIVHKHHRVPGGQLDHANDNVLKSVTLPVSCRVTTLHLASGRSLTVAQPLDVVYPLVEEAFRE